MTDDTGSTTRRVRIPGRGWALAVAAGVAVFVVVLGAHFLGLLAGWPLVVTGVLAALAIPASREFSRRVFWMSCIALGMAPLAWWLPFPIEGVSRLGIATAAVLAVLTALIVGRRLSIRALMPRFRMADALTLGAAALAAWILAPLLAVAKGSTALGILANGWDYAAHFNMTEMIRRTGSLVELAEPGRFGPWSYSEYPKGFHAAAATIMDVIVGADLRAPDAELVGFLHSTAILGIAAVTMMMAGLASLPQVRRRPLLAAPLGALVALAFLFGPGGGSLIQYGFPNFLIAVALLASIPLIVIPMERLGQTWMLLALSGTVVGIAHNWALLLIVAVGGILPMILPSRRRRWPTSPRGWTVLGLVVGLTLAGGLSALWTLAGVVGGVATGSQFLIPGGFVGGSLTEIVLPAAVAIVVCGAVWWVSIRRAGTAVRASALRTAALALLPATGLALLVSMAAFQLLQAGELSYYFYKLGAGVQLASVVLVAAAVVVLVPLAASTARRGILPGVAVVVTVLLATSSGVVNPTSEGISVRQPPGMDARVAWGQAGGVSAGHAELSEVRRAADVVTDDAPHFWIPSSLDGSTAPRLSNQWLFALTGQWSVSSYRVVDEIWGDGVPPADRPQTTAEAVRKIHQAAPDGVIVVAPQTLDRLRSDQSFDEVLLTTW